MKKQAKNMVIVVLLFVILCGGYWLWNYQEGVNRVLNYSIYSSLNLTKSELLQIRTKLERYDDKKMTVEEFESILQESEQFFDYGDYTKKYDNNISQRFAYINYLDLNFYMTSLPYIAAITTKEITTEDIEYHKENLMKIIQLWAPESFNVTDNYIEPTPHLKELIEKTNALANEGSKRIEEKQ